MMTFGQATATTLTTPQQPAGTSAATDADCIARSLVEPGAFRELFSRHHARVHRYVVSRLGPDAADDVVSETFLQAFRARKKFSSAAGTDALPWLLGIATKLMLRARGAEARWLQRLQAVAETAATAGAHATAPGTAAAISRLDASARRPDLARALAALRQAERDAFCICVLAGLTYEEAAQALNIPIGSVRSRVSRARAKLAATLAALQEPG